MACQSEHQQKPVRKPCGIWGFARSPRRAPHSSQENRGVGRGGRSAWQPLEACGAQSPHEFHAPSWPLPDRGLHIEHNLPLATRVEQPFVVRCRAAPVTQDGLWSLRDAVPVVQALDDDFNQLQVVTEVEKLLDCRRIADAAVGALRPWLHVRVGICHRVGGEGALRASTPHQRCRTLVARAAASRSRTGSAVILAILLICGMQAAAPIAEAILRRKCGPDTPYRRPPAHLGVGTGRTYSRLLST